MVGIWHADAVLEGRELFLGKVETDRLSLMLHPKEIPHQDTLRILSERKAELPLLVRMRKPGIVPFEFTLQVASQFENKLTMVVIQDPVYEG
jgi:hypothetical protein